MAAIAFRKPAWGASAALPLFILWLWNLVGIWLSLFGLMDIATVAYGSIEHYTAIEIVSTLPRTGFCLAGIIKAVPLSRALSWPQRGFCFAGLALFMLLFILFSLIRRSTAIY